MRWSGELTIDSADFDPTYGELELTLMDVPGDEIVRCEVTLADAEDVAVRYGRRYRVTVEEVEDE